LNNIDILLVNISEPAWMDKIEPFIDIILEKLKISNWEFSVTFCDNEYIRKLNNDYRGKDSATDVLTFAQDDDPLPFETVETLHNAGDIIISLHTLGENADYFGVEEGEELKRLLIHGILHLTGMDHSDNSPQQEMLIYQEKLIVELTEVKIF
jgi:probable rRNA maturation factor